MGLPLCHFMKNPNSLSNLSFIMLYCLTFWIVLQLDQSERIIKDVFFKSDSLNITTLAKRIIRVNRFSTTFSDSP